MDEQLKKMAWVYAVNGTLAGGNKGKHVFQIADRVHVQRLGRRIAVLDPKLVSMADTVAVMTGAVAPTDVVAS